MTGPRVIRSSAPIRICDLGGWTDTWFAGHGTVLNLAVTPRVEVRITVLGTGHPPVVLYVQDYGDRYVVFPGQDLPGRHPLLEATIDEIGVPAGLCVEIALSSGVPAGCGTGTSAAVTVALVGALDALTPGRLSPLEVARQAHRIEVDRLGLQSGVQDQLCSALGGINLIEIPDYPDARVTQIATSLWDELDTRLVLVPLGRHNSSAMHQTVIGTLAAEGPDAPRLAVLRSLAREGAEALQAGDLVAFGAAMSANTDAQAALHQDLVSPQAHQVIEVARRHGALGWKVNGAGGDGGSLTLLTGGQRLPFDAVPINLSSSGLRVRAAGGSGRPWP